MSLFLVNFKGKQIHVVNCLFYDLIKNMAGFCGWIQGELCAKKQKKDTNEIRRNNKIVKTKST